MTATQSPTATEGRSSRTSAPHVAHAFVQNGAIHLLQFGKVEPVSRWDAVGVLLALEGSPFPSSQERARQIKAALKETMQ
jgi:hypothetical protein